MADVWVRFDKHAPESWPVGAFLPSWVPRRPATHLAAPVSSERGPLRVTESSHRRQRLATL